MGESVAWPVTLLAAVALAAAHLLAGRMAFLEVLPRSRWLSAAAGVSVAYVFAHLLPELAEGQRAVQADAGEVLPFLETHVYLLALAGLVLFYGVERHTLRSRRSRRERDGEDRSGDDAFWLSTMSFAVYNALIGYLLVRGESTTIRGVALYTFALGVHFVINDVGLREHHKDAYHRIARWALSGAVLLGWVIGRVAEISEAALAMALAVIAGGVILNVLKEELPGERAARFTPFVAGAAAYAALLQVV